MMTLKMFFMSDEGATSIEYSMLAGVMAIVAIVAATSMGESNADIYQNQIAAKILNATDGTGGSHP